MRAHVSRISTSKNKQKLTNDYAGDIKKKDNDRAIKSMLSILAIIEAIYAGAIKATCNVSVTFTFVQI